MHEREIMLHHAHKRGGDNLEASKCCHRKSLPAVWLKQLDVTRPFSSTYRIKPVLIFVDTMLRQHPPVHSLACPFPGSEVITYKQLSAAMQTCKLKACKRGLQQVYFRIALSWRRGNDNRYGSLNEVIFHLVRPPSPVLSSEVLRQPEKALQGRS
jgi:hypothetical protein